jgi:hypothetical protein
MASRAEMRGNDSVHLGRVLAMPSRLEPPHSSLPLTRRLMRVLRAIVQVLMPYWWHAVRRRGPEALAELAASAPTRGALASAACVPSVASRPL